LVAVTSPNRMVPFFCPRIMSGMTRAPRSVFHPDLKRPRMEEGRKEEAMTAGLARGVRREGYGEHGCVGSGWWVLCVAPFAARSRVSPESCDVLRPVVALDAAQPLCGDKRNVVIDGTPAREVVGLE
jgi:hypothetical protein